MALAEGEALFPSVDEPDCVISLGTGTFEQDAPLSDATPTHFLKDSAIPRGVRSFLASMKGSRDWKAITSFGRGRSSGKYHRLDVRFNSPEPPLDDVGSIPSLSAQVLHNALTMPVMDNIVRSVVASYFYFELCSLPVQTGDEYSGGGAVRCLLHSDEPGLKAILGRLIEVNARLHIGTSCIIDISETNCLDETGNFVALCSFTEKDSFQIILEQDGHMNYGISRSPVCVRKWITAQKLDADFGVGEHRKRKQDHQSPTLGQTKRRRLH